MRSLESLEMPSFMDGERLAVACSMPWLKRLTMNCRSGNNLSDRDLQMLVGLPVLEDLHIPGTNKCTDNGFAVIVQLKHLRYFGVNGDIPVTGKGMAYLAQAPSLRTVGLWGLPIGNAGLADLAQSRSIRNLGLYGNQSISDAGLASLRQMASLRKLDIGRRPGQRSVIRDAGLAQLKDAKQLESLSFLNAEITDRGLSYLGQLPNLKVLEIPWGGSGQSTAAEPTYTADGVKALSGLTKLEALTLGGKHVDDRALDSVAQMSNLKKLSLRRCSITNVGLAKLAGLRHMEYLDIDRRIARGQEHSPYNLTIGGLAVLKGMPELQHVSIGRVVQDGATLNLAGLKRLEWLTLVMAGGQTLRNEDLACLSGLTKLWDLQLCPFEGLSDAGIQHLGLW